MAPGSSIFFTLLDIVPVSFNNMFHVNSVETFSQRDETLTFGLFGPIEGPKYDPGRPIFFTCLNVVQMSLNNKFRGNPMETCSQTDETLTFGLILTIFGAIKVRNMNPWRTIFFSHVLMWFQWDKTTSCMWIEWELLAIKRKSDFGPKIGPIRGQKAPENLAHKAHFSHTNQSTHNIPVNQVSWEPFKNCLRKWPKNSKNPNFDKFRTSLGHTKSIET